MKQYWIIGLFLLAFSCAQSSSEKEVPVNEEIPESPALEEAEQVEERATTSQEDSERTEWQNPDLVLNLLGDLEGKTVADIGAGSGYFTFKIAKQANRVIALDINPRALDYIKEQKEIVGEWSRNIETRLTPADVPNLLADEVDAVLIVNTFGFIPDKSKYLPRVWQGIKSGGRLVIVDFKSGNIPVGPSDEFKVTTSEAIKMLRRAGFKRITKDEKSLEYQYIVTAEK